MTRPFLSTLAAAAVLLAAAPAVADPTAPASDPATRPAAAAATAAAAAPAIATASAPATCEPMAKKVQDLEARLRQSEAKVAELMRDRAPTPPDSHAESY